jgi:hypothetical protein
MSITYERITEIPLKTWQRLLNDSYSSILRNKVVYWPAGLSTDQDKVFYLLKAWNRTLQKPNSFGFVGKDEADKIICMGVAIRDDEGVYRDKFTLWGKNSKGTRSYIYTKEHTDDFCSFLRDEGFNAILWTVAKDSKNETVFTSGNVPAPTDEPTSYRLVTGQRGNNYTEVFMPL